MLVRQSKPSKSISLRFLKIKLPANCLRRGSWTAQVQWVSEEVYGRTKKVVFISQYKIRPNAYYQQSFIYGHHKEELNPTLMITHSTKATFWGNFSSPNYIYKDRRLQVFDFRSIKLKNFKSGKDLNSQHLSSLYG